jgi:hypothetical protein
MSKTIDIDDFQETQEQFPWEGNLFPDEVVLPPFPDLVGQEQFGRALEERAQAFKSYVDLIRAVAQAGRQICHDHGGTNRLYIRADRWGVQCVQCTPRIRRVEGRIDAENPDFVKQGWE